MHVSFDVVGADVIILERIRMSQIQITYSIMSYSI